jgi:hypothetical protein
VVASKCLHWYSDPSKTSGKGICAVVPKQAHKKIETKILNFIQRVLQGLEWVEITKK